MVPEGEAIKPTPILPKKAARPLQMNTQSNVPPTMNMDTTIPAIVLKFGVTNANLIPQGAEETISQERAVYDRRMAAGTGESIEEVRKRRNPGLESPEVHMGCIGLSALEALKGRYLRTEYRVILKQGKHPKYSILFFFALNDEDMSKVVPMSDEHWKWLQWFALQTFQGCRFWNNADRVVVDMVFRLPNKKAELQLQLENTHRFCWVGIPTDKSFEPSETMPSDLLSEEFLEAQALREESFRVGRQDTLTKMFEKVDKKLGLKPQLRR